MILVIGAGASGLMAARTLAHSGVPVHVLEARSRLGGRIHTLSSGFSYPVENGAEWVHGDLPLTLGLLSEAGISAVPAAGRFYRYTNGVWGGGDRFDLDAVISQMSSLPVDMPLSEFLSTHVADAALAGQVRGFAEGYDLADVSSVSTLALAHEWGKDEGAQHRVAGGYSGMIDFMASSVPVTLGAVVREIHWSPGSVRVVLASGEAFVGSGVVITVPLAVLPSISFFPALTTYTDASYHLGYGTVTKVLIEFTTPFWSAAVPAPGFIVSDMALPTWWTQPGAPTLMTGWYTGTRARALGNPPDVLSLGLSSLSSMYGVDAASLVLFSRVDDWGSDPFSLGAYSYPMVGEQPFRALLNTPVADTVYFAGEGLYDGEGTPGTVEAALESGMRTAERLLKKP